MIPTYCQDTVLRVPPAATPAEDKILMREVGRRVVVGDYTLPEWPSHPVEQRT